MKNIAGFLIGMLLVFHNSYSRPTKVLVKGETALRSKEISNNFYVPDQSSGTVVGGVNVLTGQPSYSVPLYSISARGEVGFPISLNYSGPVKPIIERTNDVAPTGWIATGWHHSAPFVAINHKGTFTSADDVIFCNLGQFGGGQLLYEPDSGKYFISTNPTIDISITIQDSGDLKDQIEEWAFTMPNGVKMIFGESDDSVSNSERMVRYQKGAIAVHPSSINSTKPFIYRWDVRRIEGNSHTTSSGSKSALDFEYQKEEETLYSGKKYDRASHLKSIKWNDEFGNEVERIDYVLEDLDSGEYVGYFPNASKTDQKLFESKGLKNVKIYRTGDFYREYVLHKTLTNTNWGIKKKLDSLCVFYGENNSIKGESYIFTYNDSIHLLEEIRKPSFSIDKYHYTDYTTTNVDWSQDTVQHNLTDGNGNDVVYSAPSTNWDLNTKCTDRFCYTGAFQSDSFYFINIFHNGGNYFNKVHEERNGVGTLFTSGHIVPMNDYFLKVLNATTYTPPYTLVYKNEWNGSEFVLDTSEIYYSTNVAVYPAENYYVVQELDSKRRTTVFLRKPDGNWVNLTDSSNCMINNKAYYTATVRADTNNATCIEWNTSPSNENPTVRATQNLLLITYRGIVFSWALKEAGDGFIEVSDHMEDCPSRKNQNWPPNNFSGVFKNVHTSNDYILFQLHDGLDHVLYEIFSFEGDSLRYIQSLESTDDVKDGGERNIWVSNDYFIESRQNASTTKMVNLWTKKYDTSGIYFDSTKITDLNHDIEGVGLMDILVNTNSNLFSIEMFPAGASDSNFTKTNPKYSSDSSQYAVNLYKFQNGSRSKLPYSNIKYVDGEGTHWFHFNLRFNNALAKVSSIRVTGVGGWFEKRSAKFNLNGIITETYKDAETDDGGSISNFQRIGQKVEINESESRIKYASKFYTGEDFISSPTINVVDFFESKSSISDGSTPQGIKFEYLDGTDTVQEYNSNVQGPKFEKVKISYGRIDNDTFVYNGNGYQEYLHLVDNVDDKIGTKEYAKVGRLKLLEQFDGNGFIRGHQNHNYLKYSRTDSINPWPDSLVIYPSKEIDNLVYASNKSYTTQVTKNYNYNDSIGVFHFSYRQANEVLNQTIFGSNNLPEKVISYRIPSSRIGPLNLDSADPTAVLTIDSGNGEYVLSASKTEYDTTFPKLPSKSFIWRDTNQITDDSLLAEGITPEFNVGSNFVLVSEVSGRNNYGNPTESVIYKTDSLKVYSSVFYEGLSASSIGGIVGAPLSDCAILTMENKELGTSITTLDIPNSGVGGRWTNSGGVYDALNSHTGEHSLKVDDDYGAISDFTFTDIQNHGSDFIVSAWIYAESGSDPVLSLTRWKDTSGSQEYKLLSELDGKPVDGDTVFNKWQRWEARISYEDLTEDTLFIGADGYLRVSIGTPVQPGLGRNGGIIRVDDIVAYPSHASFQMSSYNNRWEATSTTDHNHLTVFTDYDFRGRPLSARDEKGRILSMTGYNKIGEAN